jgi:dihydroxy-acid dehydratase
MVMNLWEHDIRPRDIISEISISNAVKVCLAVGGSIHAMYHIPAIASEAGLKLDVWRLFDDFSEQIPTLVGIAPNGTHNMEDFDSAGGTPAIMNVLSEMLSGDAMTVTGNPIRTYYEAASVKNPQVIHSLETPWKKESGLAVLKGNIATGGSVLRVSGVLPGMTEFRGKAKVFTSESDAIAYVRKETIEEPTVLVVQNQGLIGAPGIHTLLPLSGEIVGRGVEDKVAVISDGRFSGGARGFCIGLVTPEAALGGEIALVKDGDFIDIDVHNRRVHLETTDAELKERKKEWKTFEPKLNSPFLSTFINTVRPLHEGAVGGSIDRGKYRTLSE